jgi:DNA-binding PadR family transcriptional regulator
MEPSKKRGRRAASDNGKLTTADLVVLSLIEERPMHGYDLLAEYQRQEVVDWASVSKAQLYYALKKLADNGLITGKSETTGDRERIVYATTKSGRDALQRALASETWARARTAQPFQTWLGLSIHANRSDFLATLTARREYLVAEIEKEVASLRFIKTLNTDRAKRGVDIVELTINQFRVELEWVESMLVNAR